MSILKGLDGDKRFDFINIKTDEIIEFFNIECNIKLGDTNWCSYHHLFKWNNFYYEISYSNMSVTYKLSVYTEFDNSLLNISSNYSSDCLRKLFNKLSYKKTIYDKPNGGIIDVIRHQKFIDQRENNLNFIIDEIDGSKI